MVISYRKYKVMKQRIRKDGYLQIRLCRKNWLAHRLIALTFIPNPFNKPEVNHKDGNETNNHFRNLEWMTTKENVRHAHKNGFVNSAKGSGHGRAKLTEAMIPLIRRYSKTKTIVRIAKLIRMKFGVVITPEAVGYVIRGKTWTHA